MVVQLEEGKRPWKILEFLLTGPKTTKEICEHMELKFRKKGETFPGHWITYPHYQWDGVSMKQVGVKKTWLKPHIHKHPYWSCWPTTRNRLRGQLEGYPKMVKYSRKTRKYSITMAGRRAIQL